MDLSVRLPGCLSVDEVCIARSSTSCGAKAITLFKNICENFYEYFSACGFVNMGMSTHNHLQSTGIALSDKNGKVALLSREK